MNEDNRAKSQADYFRETGRGTVTEHYTDDYVAWLVAERARLKEEVDRLGKYCMATEHETYQKVKNERDRLKEAIAQNWIAQNERGPNSCHFCGEVEYFDDDKPEMYSCDHKPDCIVLTIQA